MGKGYCGFEAGRLGIGSAFGPVLVWDLGAGGDCGSFV